MKWSGVLRAIFYPHGVLLELSPRIYSWLPDRSLTEGSPAQVRQLLADRLKERTRRSGTSITAMAGML